MCILIGNAFGGIFLDCGACFVFFAVIKYFLQITKKTAKRRALNHHVNLIKGVDEEFSAVILDAIRPVQQRHKTLFFISCQQKNHDIVYFLFYCLNIVSLAASTHSQLYPLNESII
ncbi:hypothetical protein BT_0450a [Bartonella tribocorum CIP 105476]|uniref:Uncharacterized protein n=1 Tax=Bartonella tribocorum (strain DSM 28219 / CCUG 45778 / CIP 105476 / IBS 506) TaxID=382640 RepID=A9IPC0_BART1|nr:hypothetical protein BT_0450a [Bartonella tribocorum CIP 105476]